MTVRQTVGNIQGKTGVWIPQWSGSSGGERWMDVGEVEGLRGLWQAGPSAIVSKVYPGMILDAWKPCTILTT